MKKINKKTILFSTLALSMTAGIVGGTTAALIIKGKTKQQNAHEKNINQMNDRAENNYDFNTLKFYPHFSNKAFFDNTLYNLASILDEGHKLFDEVNPFFVTKGPEQQSRLHYDFDLEDFVNNNGGLSKVKKNSMNPFVSGRIVNVEKNQKFLDKIETNPPTNLLSLPLPFFNKNIDNKGTFIDPKRNLNSDKFISYGLKNVIKFEDLPQYRDYIFFGGLFKDIVKLPDTWEEIKHSTFINAKFLQPLDLSDTEIKKINYDTFALAKFEDSIFLPTNLEEIGIEAFSSAKFNEGITIPSGVKQIEDAAFAEAIFNGDADFSNTAIKEINRGAFYGSKFMEKLFLPKGLETLHSGSFQDAIFEKDLIINGNLKNIGDGVFASAKFLENVDLSQTNINNISSGMFYLSNIEGELKLPNNLEYISDMAFKGARIKEKLVIPASLKDLSPNAFEGAIFEGGIDLSKANNRVKEVFIKNYPSNSTFEMFQNVDELLTDDDINVAIEKIGIKTINDAIKRSQYLSNIEIASEYFKIIPKEIIVLSDGLSFTIDLTYTSPDIALGKINWDAKITSNYKKISRNIKGVITNLKTSSQIDQKIDAEVVREHVPLIKNHSKNKPANEVGKNDLEIIPSDSDLIGSILKVKPSEITKDGTTVTVDVEIKSNVKNTKRKNNTYTVEVSGFTSYIENANKKIDEAINKAYSPTLNFQVSNKNLNKIKKSDLGFAPIWSSIPERYTKNHNVNDHTYTLQFIDKWHMHHTGKVKNIKIEARDENDNVIKEIILQSSPITFETFYDSTFKFNLSDVPKNTKFLKLTYEPYNFGWSVSPPSILPEIKLTPPSWFSMINNNINFNNKQSMKESKISSKINESTFNFDLSKIDKYIIEAKNRTKEGNYIIRPFNLPKKAQIGEAYIIDNIIFIYDGQKWNASNSLNKDISNSNEMKVDEHTKLSIIDVNHKTDHNGDDILMAKISVSSNIAGSKKTNNTYDVKIPLPIKDPAKKA